ncbi:MAG: hypothetical protein PWP06_959 [Candidatus Marinimicrobia bacterium]|jgi:hypothetical protein|nr:hypothetical protein [Candidatus Neomarinimicrobiota bacterium]
MDAGITWDGKWQIMHTADECRENPFTGLYKINQTSEKLKKIADSTNKNSIPKAIQKKICQLMNDPR